MKKLLIALVLLISTTAVAQEKDVTKFLGIPVDGSKSDMIQKLKEKGFVSSAYQDDVLEGEFNGRNVTLSVGTNNNKVYRVVVLDNDYCSEGDIKICFNKLCSQFENNARYVSTLGKSYKLSEDEDISYNMTVNNKRYEAAYLQKTADGNPCFHKIVWFLINSSYAKYRIVMFYDNALNQANGEDL
jgi:hypothetical protein